MTGLMLSLCVGGAAMASEAEVFAVALPFLRREEGFSAAPYVCEGGRRTVGYGHVLRRGEVCAEVDKEVAESLLLADAKTALRGLAGIEGLAANEAAALVSFVFNVGVSSFQISTMRGFLLRGDKAAAAGEFGRWVFVGGLRSKGLAARRMREMTLFLRG